MTNINNSYLAALLAMSCLTFATEATVKITACTSITKPGLHVLDKNIQATVL